jgi:hypothetical protein
MGLFSKPVAQQLADAAMAAMHHGNLPQAAQQLEAAAHAFVRESNPGGAAASYSNLAFVRKLLGDFRGGVAAVDEALKLVTTPSQERGMMLLTRAGLLDRLKDPDAQIAWTKAAQCFAQQPTMQLVCRAHSAGAAIACGSQDGFAIGRDVVGQLGPAPSPALLAGLIGAIGDSAGDMGLPYLAHAMLVMHRHMEAFNSSNAPHWAALVERVGYHTTLGLGLCGLGMIAASASAGKPDYAGIMQHVGGVLERCAHARGLTVDQLLVTIERDSQGIAAVRPALDQLAPATGSLAAVSAWLWARINFAGTKALGIYGRDREGHCFHVVVPLDGEPPDDAVARAAGEAGYRPRASWRLGAHELLNNEKLPAQAAAMNRMSYDTGDANAPMVLLLTTAERRALGLSEL